MNLTATFICHKNIEADSYAHAHALADAMDNEEVTLHTPEGKLVYHRTADWLEKITYWENGEMQKHTTEDNINPRIHIVEDFADNGVLIHSKTTTFYDEGEPEILENYYDANGDLILHN